MRVLLIHQLFAAPDEPGGARHAEFAQHWTAGGHQVTIVASDLCYLSGERLTDSPRLVSESWLGRVRMLRAFTLSALHGSYLGRLFAFLCFMVTSTIAGLRAGRVDVVVGTSPPLFQLASAWLVAVLRRRPLVVEIRDLWPAFAIDMGVLKNRLLIWLAQRIEAFFYRKAAAIIVNSPAYTQYLVERGVPPNKITLVANGVDVAQFTLDPATSANARQRVRKQYQIADQFLVTYCGAHGPANDLETVLQAAEELRTDPRIHFLLVGGGKDKARLQALAQQRELSNVTFAAPVPKSEVPALLAASDACLATLMDIPMFRMTYPNKVFDAMAAGRPTVLGIDGVIREVMEAASGGICVEPGDVPALASAISQLANDPQQAKSLGQAARAYVTKHFDRRDQAKQFETVLSQAALQQRSRGFLRLTVPPESDLAEYAA